MLNFVGPVESTSTNRMLHLDANRIFFNGFHYDLSRWWQGGTTSALSHCNWEGTVFDGEETAACVDLNSSAGWLEDRRPAQESTYDFYFRWDFEDATYSGEHTFFEALDSGKPVFRIKSRPEAGTSDIEIGFFAYDNNGAETSVWVTPVSHHGAISGSWEAAASGSLSGTILINPGEGAEVPFNVNAGNNSGLAIDEVRLGSVNGAASAGGTARFRQFRSWRDKSLDLAAPVFDP